MKVHTQVFELARTTPPKTSYEVSLGVKPATASEAEVVGAKPASPATRLRVRLTRHARLLQSVERAALNPVRCGFESHGGHHAPVFQKQRNWLQNPDSESARLSRSTIYAS